ncbi:hypothetical protein AMTRI_Chr11g93210 [Amborella trichopoda]|uniref:Myb/SANT-like DNA-binding domain-containing protein n=1 Tax=Amborella trichopoda TaxID=13333 RepID=W1PTB3_AMBTC|nr:trihelix transcription factor GTL1 [Amborella trichopoda]ERN13247.1 hypothetical protein AMTR_s00040p00233180 [Amborella trichopoda]|eukprot:XP_006851780.1 trihelix transcription factor GTL1 [Amborella trichopoda]
MEPNAMLTGGMPSGLLGLEMHPHQQQQQQASHHLQHHIQHQHNTHPLQIASHMASSAPLDNDLASPIKHAPYLLLNNNSRGGGGGRPSDEEDAGAEDGRGKRVSPWQRMKWTDNMVKLLIMVVFFVGDDPCSLQQGEGSSGDGKKKSILGSGGGMLQKKGKWKSVSRAMMEKGFYVSPQQCEDKFNDLNKRYKRVNDILGKGTACKVVQNQSLLETMDHLSSKMKEEVRKLLNSKHLFFREMCAYHSSCAGQQPCDTTDTPHHQMPQQQQRCFHSAETTKHIEMEASKGLRMNGGDEQQHQDTEEEDDEEDEEDEEDDEEEEEEEWGSSNKRQRKPMGTTMSRLMMSGEEGRECIRRKLVEVKEERVRFQAEALELEKQRFKWAKFSGKKERELERLKLENERNKLENERMSLLLRHKEAELDTIDSSTKRPDASTASLTGPS